MILSIAWAGRKRIQLLQRSCRNNGSAALALWLPSDVAVAQEPKYLPQSENRTADHEEV